MGLKLKTYRLGCDKPVDTLRIAVARYLPRGVKKTDWPRLFDVWFPPVAPTGELLGSCMQSKDWRGVDFLRKKARLKDGLFGLRRLSKVYSKCLEGRQEKRHGKLCGNRMVVELPTG